MVPQQLVLSTSLINLNPGENASWNSNINDIFDIEYLLSYEMLDNFQHLKNKFESADVLIINRIKS